MGDDAKDPVDHARTTRPHAGESMKNTASLPGLIIIGLAVLAFVICLVAFATGHDDTGLGFGVGAIVACVIGLGWLGVQYRRVRSIEEQWLADHPDAPRQPPAS
jgi:multisubunit Na+/H+ antiporter MnhB subunit